MNSDHVCATDPNVNPAARIHGEGARLLAALIARRDYLSCIPESAAGGDDDAVRLAKLATAAIAAAEGRS